MLLCVDCTQTSIYCVLYSVLNVNSVPSNVYWVRCVLGNFFELCTSQVGFPNAVLPSINIIKNVYQTAVLLYYADPHYWTHQMPLTHQMILRICSIQTTNYCLLCAMCNQLRTICNLQCTAMYVVLQCTVYCNVQGTAMYSVLQCTGYCNVQCTAMYSVLQCTVYCNVQCTAIYSVLQCTVYCNVQCTAIYCVLYLPQNVVNTN